MADYRHSHDVAPRERHSWFADEDARRRRGMDERDDQHPYGSDRYARYEPSPSGSGEYRDDRGSRWEGTADDRYGYGRSTGLYRTDDRAYHDRYRERADHRYDRDENPERNDRDLAAQEYYRAARDQRADYLRWSAHHNGTWGQQHLDEPDEQPAWGPRERGGYWRDYEQQLPHFVGCGPKDYQRSDDRIREEICDRMTDDPVLDATGISVEVRRQDVVLTGSVTGRWQKRRAEDIADRVSGVRDVTNQLRIMRDGMVSGGPEDASRVYGQETASSQPAHEVGKEAPSKSASSSTT